jgi:PAS domain S-box-containing protein/putative nucleotidyltransferase with HDIG domain
MFRQLTENVRDVFWITTCDASEIFYVSPAFEEVWGRSIAELRREPLCWTEAIPPDERTGVINGFREQVRLREPWRAEFRIVRPDGSIRWIRARGFPICDAAGNVTRITGIAQDITESKRALELVRQSEQRLRAVVEQTFQLCAILSPEGTILDFNRSGQEFNGQSYVELVGSPFWAIACFQDSAENLAAIKRAVAEAARALSARYQAELLRSDGAHRRIDIAVRPIFDDAGEVIYVIAEGHDITDALRAEETIRTLNLHLHERLERQSALRRVDTAITAGEDLDRILTLVIEIARSQLGAEAAAVQRFDAGRGTLTFAACGGPGTSSLTGLTIPLADSLIGRVIADGGTMCVPNMTKTGAPPAHLRGLVAAGLTAFHAIQLKAKSQVKGAFAVFHRSHQAHDQEWLDFLAALATQTALAVIHTEVVDGLRRSNAELVDAYEATIDGWSRALDLRDEETDGHSRRVAELTVKVAAAMGVSDADLVHVRRGALLHDIGKMGIPDEVLQKAGPLTEAEWHTMRQHPRIAYDLLRSITFLRPALDIPYCHHERWDGTGYPRGLRGEEIPIAARIFAVADIWDALLSDRPYREAWDIHKVRRHLTNLAGNHLDPTAVAMFLRTVDRPGAGFEQGVALSDARPEIENQDDGAVMPLSPDATRRHCDEEPPSRSRSPLEELLGTAAGPIDR